MELAEHALQNIYLTSRPLLLAYSPSTVEYLLLEGM